MDSAAISRGPQPNDLIARSNEIKDCVAGANMELAVKRLIDFVRDFCQEMENEVILISMDFYDLSRNERMKVLERDVIARDRRSIALRILYTVNSAKQQILEK